MQKNLILLICLCLLPACAGASQDIVIPEDEMPAETPASEFRVIGYATAATIVETVPFERLTHINYAFLIPNSDGTFENLPNAWKLEQLIAQAHEHGARVLISVGGWGWDDEFEAMAASPETRAVFVSALAAFVDEFGLDGADIDWEYPDAGQSAQNFLSLMGELRRALPDRLLTIAVVAAGTTGEGIPPESFALLDFVNIMAYDGSGENHSSMPAAEEALDYWLGRGLPADKAVLGVPFYSRPDGTPYYRIVQYDPAAAQVDTFDYYGTLINYNGIPTMQAKTRLAMERCSGIMIWALDHDAAGELSLLAAIDQTIHGGE